MALKIRIHESLSDIKDDIEYALDGIEKIVKDNCTPPASGPGGGEITLVFDCPSNNPKRGGSQVIYKFTVCPWIYDRDGKILGKGGLQDVMYTIQVDISEYNNRFLNVTLLVQHHVTSDKGYSFRYQYPDLELSDMQGDLVTDIVKDLKSHGYFG